MLVLRIDEPPAHDLVDGRFHECRADGFSLSVIRQRGAGQFVTMLQCGQPAFGMFDDLPRKYHRALPLLEYNNAETLLAAFEKK